MINKFLLLSTLISSGKHAAESDYSRDGSDKVHFCLVADADQMSVHCLTCITSCFLLSFGRRNVVAVVVVVVPAGRTE